jgi:HSP20 family protein
VLDDALTSLTAGLPTERSPTRSPALDVAETDTAYTVTLEVPGVKKSDLKVTVEDRRVSITAAGSTAANASSEAASANANPASTDTSGAAPNAGATGTAPPARVLYRERTALRYERSFTVPAEVDAALASAKLEDGILVLELPKRSAVSASQLTIN